jgi:microcystin-dependent protein
LSANSREIEADAVATPEKPVLDYSFTAFQEAQGDNTFPGTQLDAALANLKQANDDTIDFVSEVIRSDGKLANGVVTKASLDETLLLGLAPPRAWEIGEDYVVDDTVFVSNTLYICVFAHLADDFADELTAGYWQAYATFEPLSTISDGTVTEPKHATGGVSTRALADLSVTTAKYADASITQAKLSAALAAMLLPVGLEADFSGPFAPSGWVFKAGQELSRVTYAALFTVLCPSAIGNVANASATVSGLVVDLRGIGLEGALVEGPGIPGGATVASIGASSITLSVNATSSTTGAQIRLFPHGRGDGVTTFNVPDDCDRASVGRGNMGVIAANRITATGAGNPGLDTTKLGAAAGVDRHAITIAQLALHGHNGSVAINDPGHAHSFPDYGIPIGGIGNAYTPGGTPAVDDTTRATVAATTGITASLSIVANGGGEAHPNVQPSRVVNKIIFTGVV